MGGALMELVAKGSQDIFLTGNPKVSYFRSVYKRHTNFSHESIKQSITGQLDFGKTVEVIISRSGDLLSSINLEIDLPKISGKYGKTISYIDSIGHYIIDKIDFMIGEQIIDTHYGEWLEIWSELTLSESHKNGYNTMIGKNITITEAKTLIIPLQFWFCRNYGLALPLVALQYHQVKLMITLKPFSECWKKDFDTFYLDKVNNVVTINSSVSDDVVSRFSDLGLNTTLNDGSDNYFGMKLLWSDGTEDTVQNRVSGNDQSLTLETNSTVPNKTGYAYLIKGEPSIDVVLDDFRVFGDYIFLDTGERKFFAQNKHLYLIEQLQNNGINSYTKGQESNKIDLDFNHPCKELIWVNSLDFNKKLNLPFNYSDRVDTSYGSDNPVKDAIIHINGQERFDSRTADYFRLLVPYQKHSRIPENYIYVYSFAIKPEDNQPSGTCNYSRLNTSELTINFVNGIDDLTTRIYAINYNMLNIVNGMGGLAYSN